MRAPTWRHCIPRRAAPVPGPARGRTWPRLRTTGSRRTAGMRRSGPERVATSGELHSPGMTGGTPRGLEGVGADTPISVVGERALLRHLRARIPGGPGVVTGVGDDAAAVTTSALTLVTTDCMVERVHFRREWAPPPLLGRKALTVNLSDIAAMAGAPRYATVSLCLTPDTTLGFVDGLYDGLLSRAAECGVEIVGGNLAAAESALVIDVTLLGTGDRLLLRSGAQPGDVVVVTGTLGGAAAGLRCLLKGARL